MVVWNFLVQSFFLLPQTRDTEPLFITTRQKSSPVRSTKSAVVMGPSKRPGVLPTETDPRDSSSSSTVSGPSKGRVKSPRSELITSRYPHALKLY